MAKTVIGRNLPLYKGNYDSNTTYDIYDVVVLNGSSYVSKKKNNAGNNPGENTEYWQLLAKCGAKGDKGNKGEKGDTPVAGVDYYTNEERERFKNAVIDASKQDIENLTETKITEFNTNATEKTNTFNSNSTQKISDYNDNHTAKLNEYNRTAEEVINSFDIVSKYIDAEHDTVVTDENIETTINDSTKWYGKIDARGRTEQEQYNGKNLFNISASSGKNGGVEVTVANNKLTMEAISTTGSQFAIYIIDGLDETKTYNFSFKAKKIVKGTDGDGRIRAYLAGSNDGENYTRITYADIANPEVGTEYSLTNNFTAYKYLRVYLYNNLNTPVTIGEKVEYYDIQLEEGNVATDYEKYVGGQASPNTEYPQPIKNVEGNINFKICNKNLCNRVANNYYNPATGTIQNGTDARYRTFVADYAPVGNYTFSTNIQNCYILRAWMDGASVQVNTQSNSYQISITKPGKIMICVRNSDTTEITENVIAQIEKNTVATDYEQNSQQTVTFPLSDGQKLMEGDYLADDGVHHVRGKYEITGNEDITVYNTGSSTTLPAFNIPITNMAKVTSTSLKSNGSCNYYRMMTQAEIFNQDINGIAGRVNQNAVIIKNTEISTRADFVSAVKELHDNGTPIVVEHELATEIIDPYTPAQQEARNQLQKLMLNYGTNHIWTETEGLNPNIIVTYKKSNRIKNENEIENIKNAIISMGGNI